MHSLKVPVRPKKIIVIKHKNNLNLTTHFYFDYKNINYDSGLTRRSISKKQSVRTLIKDDIYKKYRDATSLSFQIILTSGLPAEVANVFR